MRAIRQKHFRLNQQDSLNVAKSSAKTSGVSRQGGHTPAVPTPGQATGWAAASTTELENSAAGPNATATGRFGHDFSRVPIHSETPVKVQTKPAVSAPGDISEQEADRASEHVISMPDSVLHRAEGRGAGRPEPRTEESGVERAGLQARQAGAGEVGQTTAPPVVRDVLRSPGQPLDPATRAFMEPRFGHDFSHVRVHTGPRAAESARAVDALAYTLGRDVVFGAAQYAPGSADGRRLLAHELAHVVQQRSAAPARQMVLQRKANAVRFQKEPTLDEISDGKKVLKEGDKGEAVIRITTALSELGHYTISIIDEKFDPPLTSAVMNYQDAKGLKGKVTAGDVEQLTFKELDKDFSASYKVERDVIGKQSSADLTKGTQTLNDEERAAGQRAISTEAQVDPSTGLLPTFVPDIKGKGKYEDRLRTLVEAIVLDEYKAMGAGKAAAHADPKNLYDWKHIEAIAKQSQDAVEKIFGEYTKVGKGKTPDPLTHGVNIFDAWEDKEKMLTAGGKAAEDSSAEWRVEKIITGSDEVEALDKEHGAIQSRPAEKTIVAKVKAELVTKHRAKLIETHKGWPGYADSDKGKIFIQVFKQSDDKLNRRNMWRFYQTFIHEYLHTLEHPDHRAFRGTMTQQKGGFALREGVPEYFTKVVWNGIKIDDALRKQVEGPFHDPAKPFTIPPLNTYAQANNAERLAGVVGVRNLAAAFFLGKVDLIGKK